MKKILFVASITRHILAFHIPYLKLFKEAGYEVHVATKGEEEIPYCDKHFEIKFERSPFRASNLKAYKELKKIIDAECYDIIECNTPVASVLTRLAAKKTRKQNNTRVIYIAHGFHFFKGAPILNWITFYPIEKFLSNYTDDLITINKEDFEIAKNKLKAKNVYQIHGIGVDETKFNKQITVEERKNIRKSLNLLDEDFVIFFAGELNKNKNQIMLIEAMKDLVKENKNIKLLIAGDGILKDFYESKIKEYKLEDNVFLLGYRNDVPEILKAVDLYASASMREGLPLNILEAQMMSLPIVATDVRGHNDLIKNDVNGYLVKINDHMTFTKEVKELFINKELRKKFEENGYNSVQKYILQNVKQELSRIYFE